MRSTAVSTSTGLACSHQQRRQMPEQCSGSRDRWRLKLSSAGSQTARYFPARRYAAIYKQTLSENWMQHVLQASQRSDQNRTRVLTCTRVRVRQSQRMESASPTNAGHPESRSLRCAPAKYCVFDALRIPAEISRQISRVQLVHRTHPHLRASISCI